MDISNFCMISSVAHYHSLMCQTSQNLVLNCLQVFPLGINESFTIFAVLAAELNSSRENYLVLALEVLVR